MDSVLLLSTHWKDDYWESNDESTAIYPDRHYTDMDGWVDMSEDCPVAGIGIYHTRINYEAFVYLKINEMTYKSHSGEPQFVFETISVSDTPSYSLNQELSNELYHSIDADTVLSLLDEMGETPPEEWSDLLNWGSFVWISCSSSMIPATAPF